MIVVPLLEVKDTVLVAISTLVDQWNFFSVLMELKDPKGENVFNVYRQQLVCNRCMDRKNPEKCTHNDHMIPPWKSKRQVETARLIFGDDTGALKSESLGLVDGNTGSVFSAVSIKNLRAAALYDVATTNDAPPKFVFVACDPNAGGPDHTAIVALAHIAGRIVVLGGETKPTNADESLNLVHNFVRNIRTHPYWGDAWIIYICESNTGHESGHHANMLIRDFARVYCLRDHLDTHRNYGVCTTFNRKQDYASVLRTNLNMQRMCFAKEFITSTNTIIMDTTSPKNGGSNGAKLPTFHNDLYAQMQRARTITRSKNSTATSARITWDAKCRDDGTPCPGLRDDNLLALCMAGYFSERFLLQQIPTVEYHLFGL